MDKKNISSKNKTYETLPTFETLQKYSKKRNIQLLYLSICISIFILIWIISYLFKNTFVPNIRTEFKSPSFSIPSENSDYFKFKYLAPNGYDILEEDFGQNLITTPIVKTIEFKSNQDCSESKETFACETDNLEIRIIQLSAFMNIAEEKHPYSIAQKILEKLTFESKSQIQEKKINNQIFYTNATGNFLLLSENNKFAVLFLIGSKFHFLPILGSISIGN